MTGSLSVPIHKNVILSDIWQPSRIERLESKSMQANSLCSNQCQTPTSENESILNWLWRAGAFLLCKVRKCKGTFNILEANYNREVLLGSIVNSLGKMFKMKLKAPRECSIVRVYGGTLFLRIETLELENKNVLEKRKHSFGPENHPVTHSLSNSLSGFRLRKGTI